jgi:hypothetical protein
MNVAKMRDAFSHDFIQNQLFARIQPAAVDVISKEDVLRSGLKEFAQILICKDAFDVWFDSEGEGKQEWPGDDSFEDSLDESEEVED